MSNYETEYLKLAQKILDEGEYTEDRTGTGTYSIVGAMIRHNLSKSFPIPTSKKINFNLVAGELLFFLNGSSDRRILQEKSYGSFEESKHDIWKLDCDKGLSLKPHQFNSYNLGEMYPEYWRMLWSPHMDTVVEILKRFPSEHKPREKFPDFCGNLVGEGVSTKELLEVKVFDKKYVPSLNHSVCTLQFKNTGYVVYNVKYNSKGKYQTKDRYHKNLWGVGYLGDEVQGYEERLYNMWRSMIKRCYDTTDANYSRYGGSGVTVHTSWHSFSDFYKDVYTLPNFQKWYNNEGEWALDKDYLNGKVYSKDTCVFLPKSVNSKLTGRSVISSEGKIFFSLSDAEAYEGIARRGDYDRLAKRGYRYFNTDKGDKLVRPKLFKDQISDLVSSIKQVSNGDYHTSRRLFVNNWNMDHGSSAVLAACHTGFQCVVRNGKLNLVFSMRSNDLFLGNPYNFSSYSLLCHILAQLTGLEVGEVVYFGTDVHLYSNHIDQIKEQLSRELVEELPQIKMPKFNTLEELLSLTGKDFIIKNYHPHAFIKGKQAS